MLLIEHDVSPDQAAASNLPAIQFSVKCLDESCYSTGRTRKTVFDSCAALLQLSQISFTCEQSTYLLAAFRSSTISSFCETDNTARREVGEVCKNSRSRIDSTRYVTGHIWNVYIGQPSDIVSSLVLRSNLVSNPSIE